MIRGAALLGAGALAGVYGSRWVRRKARALTPAGLADALADRVVDARDGFREFAADVRVVADRREREIYDHLRAPGRPELPRGPGTAGRID